jgi:hypothetical protein
LSAEELTYLFSPQAIREKSQLIYELALKGKSIFEIDLSKLKNINDDLITLMRSHYPNLDVPYHSRTSHFVIDGIDYLEKYESYWDKNDDMRKSKTDLVIISVLLDSGAGSNWKYFHKMSNKFYGRSEGLALASLDLFSQGLFSSNPDNKFQVDSKGLERLTFDQFLKGIQDSPSNKLLGSKQRFLTLKNLIAVLRSRDEIFSENRPSGLLSYFQKQESESLTGAFILKVILETIGSIWPSRFHYEGNGLGDTWSHSLLGEKGTYDSFVPFHKLSQWLSYSLIELMNQFQIEVLDIWDLTGLAEYRNGGLFVDYGVMVVKDKEQWKEPLPLYHDYVIEWRALTIKFLEDLAVILRESIGKDKYNLPMSCVLQGGTWELGRLVANKKRKGAPPLNLLLDGVYF